MSLRVFVCPFQGRVKSAPQVFTSLTRNRRIATLPVFSRSPAHRKRTVLLRLSLVVRRPFSLYNRASTLNYDDRPNEARSGEEHD